MKVALLTLLFLLCSSKIVISDNSHALSEASESGVTKDASAIVEKMKELLCKPMELTAELKLRLLEDESVATERLDMAIRSKYKFDKKDVVLIASDRSRMLEESIKGTKAIRDHFVLRWQAVSNLIKTDPNKTLKKLDLSIQNHIKAVTAQYDSMLAIFEKQKAESVESSSFTGVGCAACTVGYPKLATGLKKHGFVRGQKPPDEDCPKEEKSESN